VKPIRARPHRLPEAAYLGRKCVAFTVCEIERQPCLTSEDVFQMVRQTLTDASGRYGCSVPIFCLMPDHLHVLMLGLSDASQPKRAMEGFKQKSGEWFAKQWSDVGWQKDFYDRIVRQGEGYENVARYIALNPVRAGLASDVYEWPYVDSIGYEFRETIEDAWW
jgi:REP element-mobilizing transposase RayT